MIATILKSSSTFSAVDYNERKVSKGMAELLEITNFGYLQISGNLSSKALREYLIKYSSVNQNTKNTQFHLSISCKKQEYTHEQLVDIAHRYLKEMGYANEGQPVLIYAHHDTGNNHVHIVTSRISPNGLKINDHNERLRSQAIINKIMGIKPKKDVKSIIQLSLAYSFETLGQFQAILESCGYESYIEEDNINVKKGGVVLDKVSIEEVTKHFRKKETEESEKRRKQLKAILLKYQRLTSNKEELNIILKKKFGVYLVFVGKKDSPYGYMVVDHKGKTVYKGKDVLPIKELLNFQSNHQTSKESQQTEIPAFIHQLLEEDKKQTIGEINKTLWRKFRVNIYHDGFIRDKKHNVVAQVDLQDYEVLRGNFKKEWLQKFNPSTEEERVVLCKFGHIEDEFDIQIVPDRNKEKVDATIDHIQDILMTAERDQVYKELSKAKIVIMRKEDSLYAIDIGGTTIVNLRDTDIDLSKLVKAHKSTALNITGNTAEHVRHNNAGNVLRPTGSDHHANREWEVGGFSNWDEIDDDRRFKR